MKIGIDISHKNISVALLENNNAIRFVNETIYDKKRESNRKIMERVISIIHHLATVNIESIGLSLPSKIDNKRGVVYDLKKIPYWKGWGIKHILEKKFHTQVWPDNDVNCFMLAEKDHGKCKHIKNALCIFLGPSIGVSILLNGKLFIGNKHLHTKSQSISLAEYDYIRIYKNSFIRTISDLFNIYHSLEKHPPPSCTQKTWDELGASVGRLVCILLCNYSPDVIVLGGAMAEFHLKFAEAMDHYLAKVLSPHTLTNLVVSVSTIDHPQALGAASLSRAMPIYKNREV